MALRKRRSKGKPRKKAARPADPIFAPIKAKIEAARNKLRQQANKQTAKTQVHKKYVKLKDAHRLLGFGRLDNIII